MPVISGVGQSSETARKQLHFSGLLKKQMLEAKGVMGNPQNTWCDSSFYQYFDLYAGGGWWLDDNGIQQKGSPLIFLDTVEDVDIPYRAYFIDIEPENIDSLRASVPRYHLPFCTFSAADNAMAMRPHLKAMTYQDKRRGMGRKMGMVYVDPNHGGHINWRLLAMINRVEWHERTDIVIYVGATSIKRWRKNSKLSFDAYLTEQMMMVGKSKWLVRRPYGKNQWTFLLGTKWAGMKAWEKEGFYDFKSEEGARILHRLNYTPDESCAFDGAAQLSLF